MGNKFVNVNPDWSREQGGGGGGGEGGGIPVTRVSDALKGEGFIKVTSPPLHVNTVVTAMGGG